MSDYVLNATLRTEQGKGASHRLRKTGMVPAIVYGLDKDPMSICLQHKQLQRNELDGEAFFFSIIDVEIEGAVEPVLIRDLQRHPYKPIIMHVDLMRVDMKAELSTTVPLNIIGADDCAAIKAGGSVSQIINEVDISCMPSDLPEMINVDISGLAEIGDSITLSQIVAPEGVTLSAVAILDELEDDDAKSEADQAVVNIQPPIAAEDLDAPVEEATTEVAGADGDSEGDASGE